ncbi:MAG: head GIN domain-containing protein [Lutibacter sp.]|uniref:head GIN domain-containing protein n=1 Tax=Lutibacter sp. TaxID=1925666 RepID=UPI00385939D2
MKTVTSILVFLIITATLNAQVFTKKIKGNGDFKIESRTVSNFDKISVAGSFDVQLIKGNEGEIVIKADKNLLEYIVTEVDGNKLKIKTKKGFQIKASKTIKITVSFSSIDAVSIAGSGTVFSEENINSDNLKLSLAGSGNLNLKVSSTSLKTSIAGSGNITLTGKTNIFKASIAGSGNINAYELKANVIKVSITGSGNAKVNAINEIGAITTGSGNIYYKGNPKIEKAKSIGSGAIKNKN